MGLLYGITFTSGDTFYVATISKKKVVIITFNSSLLWGLISYSRRLCIRKATVCETHKATWSFCELGRMVPFIGFQFIHRDGYRISKIRVVTSKFCLCFH